VIDESTTYTQPTAGTGPQSQATALPQAGLSTQGQVGPQSILLGSASGYDTASLLNQTRVLGASSTQEAPAPKAYEPHNKGHLPVMIIAVALVMMIVVALLFRMIDKNRENNS
jgi:hypothetical protein